MSDHYFTDNPKSLDKTFEYRTSIEYVNFVFKSGSGVFSKQGIDFGSKLLIKTVLEDLESNKSGNENINKENLVLADLGAGIGVIGLVLGKLLSAKKTYLYEVNKRALLFARENIKLNSLKGARVIEKDIKNEELEESFNICVSNPPIRAGKETVFTFYQRAFNNLESNGIFYCVIQKKQGSESSKKKLEEIFSKVEVIEKKGGYHIYKCIKASSVD